MSTLKALLKENNLSQYYELFTYNNIITINDFKKLYYTDLEKLGIVNLQDRRRLYELICECKQKPGHSFLTDIDNSKLLLNSFFQSKCMKEESLNTSKLINKSEEVKTNKSNGDTTQLLEEAKEKCDDKLSNKEKQDVSSSIDELGESIYELRYGNKKDIDTLSEDVNRSVKDKNIKGANETVLSYTNLFYNSSNVNQSKTNKKDRMLISSIFDKPDTLDVASSTIKQMSDLFKDKQKETVSQDCLQGIKQGDNMIQRITVCVRKRPIDEEEKDIVKCVDKKIEIKENITDYDLTKKVQTHAFSYDFVYDHDVTNDTINKELGFVCNHVLNGGNGSMIAYGQTGTGKTYTMFHPTNGLVFLGLEKILKERESVFISFFEIYNSQLYDLLDYREKIHLREKNGSVFVQNITEHIITTIQEGKRLINEGMLVRRRGVTGANDESSRSHAVFKISFHQNNYTNEGNCMVYVDLAGSERGNDRKNVDQHVKNEGAEINKSLLALKECIRGINNSKSHLPFRQSKLTQVLKNSFMGNGVTCVIATINPNIHCIEHTLNTLRYASRIKKLKTNTKVKSSVFIDDFNQLENTTVSGLKSHFETKSKVKRTIILDDQRTSLSTSKTKESSSESQYLTLLAQKKITEANFIILSNKKIESLSKKIVKHCATSNNPKLLRKAIDLLKFVEDKISDMKF